MTTDRAAHPDADPLLALAERVEAGERTLVLECEIAAAFDDARMPPPAWLSSLDAISALQEAVLPGWRIARLLQHNAGRAFEFALQRRADFVAVAAPTEPAARLAALLRAVAMEREDG